MTLQKYKNLKSVSQFAILQAYQAVSIWYFKLGGAVTLSNLPADYPVYMLKGGEKIWALSLLW